MALIKCPECGNDVSSSASSCPNCGYPITKYAEELLFNAEVERLTKQVKHVDFVCPEPRMKVCIKCGHGFFYSSNCNHEHHGLPMCECHMGNHRYPGIEVDYPEQQSNQQADGSLGSALYIYENCVIPNHIGDADSPEYKKWKDDLYRQIQRSEKTCRELGRPNWQIRPIPPDKKYFGVTAEDHPLSPRPTPPKLTTPPPLTCPKCGSTNITTGARGVNWTWGLIGASKTVNRCGNCGHVFKPKG